MPFRHPLVIHIYASTEDMENIFVIPSSMYTRDWASPYSTAGPFRSARAETHSILRGSTHLLWTIKRGYYAVIDLFTRLRYTT